jgi:ribosomal protein S18 acetylase RimI-like enzyme
MNTAVPQVADLTTTRPAGFADLWQHEAQLWRERLCWDISEFIDRIQRAVEHGSLSGKVIQAGTRTLGCALYQSSGALGLLSNFVISPECNAGAAEILLQEALCALRRAGTSRIESPFISFDTPWLRPLFERAGFRSHWREFLRYELRPTHEPAQPPNVHLQKWPCGYLREAASIMRAAYAGGIDAEISELYQTENGCELMLDDVLNQGVCGNPIVAASALAQQRGQSIGFIILTEVGPQHAHVAQVAVLPTYQHEAVGRTLLNHALSVLADCGFMAVSLIVSRLNLRALELYRLIGFRPVLSFPVFVHDAEGDFGSRHARGARLS